MAGSHKRDLPARPFPRTPAIAAAVALVATAGVVTAGTTLSSPDTTADVAAVTDHATRPPVLSRSTEREPVLPAGTLTPLPTHTSWTTADLNLYTQAGTKAAADGELAQGKQVTTTDITRNGRVQVIVGGVARWVTSSYLTDQKPLAAVAGLSDAPCPDMSIERGLKPQTVRVYRALCHAFPQVTQWAGLAPRSEHDTGNAIDAMVYGDKALGDAIAAWAQQNAAALDLYDLIWYDRIWTPVRASEGWRNYGDHGSPTANHMDHVHLGTN